MILIDGRLIENNITGIGRYSKELIKIYQKRYGNEKIKVLINNELDTSKLDFKYLITKYKPFNIFHFMFLHIFLKNENIEIYHSLFYANTFFKLKNCKYITTIHDLMYLVVNGFFGKNRIKNIIGKLYYNFIVGRSLKNSDTVISVSKTTKNDLYRIFGYDSQVIYEGVNEIVGVKKEVDILKDKSFFLYVGNSRPHKNIDFLIKTFTQAVTNKYLVLAGNNYKSNNNRVITLGYVSDEELNWLYSKCEAFIFPSLYEGFGLPILEALNKGAIVFSSTGGALSEFPHSVVKYFNPKKMQELKYLIENVDRMSIKQDNIDVILKEYSWENIGNRYNEMMNKY